MEDFTESQDTSKPVKVKNGDDLIVPPGLIHCIAEFEAFYNNTKEKPNSKGEPIVIAGATGVGKSLFLRILEKLWQEDRKEKDEILRVNCSHFRGNMARSELFGHVKGAYTGAIKDKVGWIRVAHQKRFPLILDEIGELAKEVQAQLLTVVEDGKFSRMGSTEIEKSAVWMIGATNNYPKLEFEFRQRFVPFHIPPIHQRRGDILYYLQNKFPELVKSLRLWEVLILLSYNWPGNVREIERVALLLHIFRDTPIYELGRHKEGKERKSLDQDDLLQIFHGTPKYDLDKEWQEGIEKSWLNRDDPLTAIRLFYLNPDYWYTKRSLGKSMEEGGFSAKLSGSLHNDLAKKGVDVKNLQRLLNKYRIGLFPSSRLAFPELSSNSPQEMSYETEYQERFGIKAYKPYKPFEEAFEGFILFCFLFFQVTQSNQNVMEVKKGTPFSLLHSDENFFHLLHVPGWRMPPLAEKLQKPILEYLSGVHLPREKSIPKAPKEREIFFNDLFTQNPSNEFLASITGREVKESTAGPDIFSMTDTDFQKYFYKGILDRCGGNQKQAAARLGLNYNTFRGRLKKLRMI